MKRFSEQLKKQSKSIRLSSQQRDDLRARIVSYMEYHPLPTAMQSQKTPASGSPSFIFSYFASSLTSRTTFMRGFMSLGVLLLLVVPFVAEKAVPGDALYPVKIRFNEELRSNLSLSPYAKVEWETQRLERRIAEARLLAEEGKLTDEIGAEVALAVQNHSTAAQQGIAIMRESDSDEAAIAEIVFASALAVQSEVLENRVAKEDVNDESGYSVMAIADAVAGARTGAEAAQTDTQPSFEKLLARIEAESTRAQELFISIRGEASAQEVAHIEQRLAAIQQKVHVAIAQEANTRDVDDTQGTSSAESSKLSDVATTSTSSVAMSAIVGELENKKIEESTREEKNALQMLREALSDTKKLISFMTDINVRTNVDIEELVPTETEKGIEVEVRASSTTNSVDTTNIF